MIALFQDPALLIAICASFVVGLLGYIIVRLWIKPVVHYNLIKRRLDNELNRYLDQLKENDEKSGPPNKAKHGSAILRTARKHAHELNTCYSKEIPYWYRLLLDSRKISPSEAEGLLTNINKIRGTEQVVTRIANARQMAGMRPYR